MHSFLYIFVSIVALQSCVGDITGVDGTDGQDASIENILGRLQKPTLYPDTENLNQIKILASDEKPATVSINDSLHVRTADFTASLLSTGNNGMELGPPTANSLQYVYAVVGEEAPAAFDLVISNRSPDLGLSVTDQYTYLGAIFIDGNQKVAPFTCSLGDCLLAKPSETFSTASSTVEELTLKIPASAHQVYAKAYFSTAMNTVSLGEVGNSDSCFIDDSCPISILPSSMSGSSAYFINLALILPQTLYFATENSSNILQLEIWGWKENIFL